MNKKQKKQEKTRTNQDKPDEFKRNKELSLIEAKKDVFSLIQKGYNYRDITQEGYLIDGVRSKRFSIAEISRIKKEFENLSDSENVSDKINLDKSAIFKYLDKNYKLTEIVLKTNFDPIFVKTVYSEWLELNKYSTTLVDEIYHLFESFNHNISNEKKLLANLKYVLECHLVLKSLYYICTICKKPVYLAPRKSTDWKWDLTNAMKYLSQNNYHHECGCKGPTCVITTVPLISNP